MNTTTYGLMLILSALLTSCVFVPKVSDKQEYAEECEMLTRNLTLSAEAMHIDTDCGNGADPAACLIAFGVIIPAGSFIVSGSIVLIGNTLHWIEYQGTC